MELTKEVQQILDLIDNEITVIQSHLKTLKDCGRYKKEYQRLKGEMRGLIWIRSTIRYHIVQGIKKNYVGTETKTLTL